MRNLDRMPSSAPAPAPETDWSARTDDEIHDAAWRLIEEKEKEVRYLPEGEKVMRMADSLRSNGFPDATAQVSDETWRIQFSSPKDGEVMNIAFRPSSDPVL